MATKLDIVTLEEAKEFLKTEDIPEHDSVIERLIESAIDRVEQYTNWRLWQREEVLTVYNTAELFQYPMSITSVKDADLVDYSYVPYVEPLRTIIRFGGIYDCVSNEPITITLQVGFSTADLSKIPAPFRNCIQQLVVYGFENRGNIDNGQITNILMQLDQYRRYTYF